MRRTALISGVAGLGLVAFVIPAMAQFNDQDIPDNCLVDGRFVLNAENAADCSQYAYVQAPEGSGSDAGAGTGSATGGENSTNAVPAPTDGSAGGASGSSGSDTSGSAGGADGSGTSQ